MFVRVLSTLLALVLKLILQLCTTLPLNAMCTILAWFINVRKTSWKKNILEHKYNRRCFLVVEIVLREKRSEDTTFTSATYHSWIWLVSTMLQPVTVAESKNAIENCFWFSYTTKFSSNHNSLFWKISTIKIFTFNA